MTEKDRFPRLEEAVLRIGAKTGGLSRDELRELLCHDCEFWHDEHEEDLECSCFKMLRLMLERGALTPAALAEAVRPPEGDE